MAGVNPIKSEGPIKAETPIKAELLDDGSPMALDDDIYEDAGDLEFYDPNLPNNPFGQLYMARVPKYVWEAWNKLDDDQELRIGTVRQWRERDKKGRMVNRMKILLRSDLSSHQGIPKEFDMDFSNHLSADGNPAPSKNTFVFSEQDLPGFRARNKARTAAAAAGIPAYLLRQKDRVEKPGDNQGAGAGAAGGGGGGRPYGRRNRQEYFRKAIPKNTAIYGRVAQEATCIPVKNPESDYLLNQRAIEMMKPKDTVKFSEHGATGLRVLGSSTIAAHDYATDFIKTVPTAPKVKKSENKTARMPENVLLDLIFQSFDQFRYWSLKSLRARIPQPEAYLRATLEKVAELHRSGTFANNWELKPENRRQGSATSAVIASVDGGVSESDGEDDDMKMEDVI